MSKYYVVRTDRAGVFFGEIVAHEGNCVTMANVRKLYYWKGACAVEELAMNGVARPKECKFTVVIPRMLIADPIQVIPCTDEAAKNLAEVPVWKY